MKPIVEKIKEIVREENLDKKIREQFKKHIHCACSNQNGSKFYGIVDNNLDNKEIPLMPGVLTKKHIRNLNGSKVYQQVYQNCFCYAACSAYINTVLRIYGSRPPPSFADCYKIADYNNGLGGSVKHAIELLEEHFQYGICCDEVKELTIRDAITLSTVISFSTSADGYNQISEGSLLKYPGGVDNGWHATLIDGYDFDQKCFICKNSWGNITAKPRFYLSPYATHSFYYTRVYFTTKSIEGKALKTYTPVIRSFFDDPKKKFIYDGQEIKCVWMDKDTAFYESDYVSEFIPEKSGPCKFVGFDVYQYISINSR